METVENKMVLDSVWVTENQQINEFEIERERGGLEPNLPPLLEDCEPLDTKILCPVCDVREGRVYAHQEADNTPITEYVNCDECGLLDLPDDWTKELQ